MQEISTHRLWQITLHRTSLIWTVSVTVRTAGRPAPVDLRYRGEGHLAHGQLRTPTALCWLGDRTAQALSKAQSMAKDLINVGQLPLAWS
jgi:hypothetical protein